MIHIPDLTLSDIGRWVVYRKPHCAREEGRLKGWTKTTVFVVYRCNEEWDRYREFTGQLTDPKDLEFMKELFIDPERVELPETGIYIRAKDLTGKWSSVDIAHIKLESLYDFLRSRGGDNRWAENTVAILLGHNIPEPPVSSKLEK